MINRENLFTWPPIVFFWALICALLWGSAFPMVKAGFVMLDIQHSTGGKLYFAAYRFLLAGMMIFAGVLVSGKTIGLSHRRDYVAMVLTGLLQTTLQYTFFYIGLSNTTGVKASIIIASGSFFLALFSHLWFKDDPITVRKSTGLIFGFVGIVLVNLQGDGLDFHMTLTGEGFILLTALSSTLALVVVKKTAVRVYPPLMCAYQLVAGAVALFLFALFFESPAVLTFSGPSLFLLFYLSFLSAAAFSLWYLLIQANRLSSMAVYRFLIPVCAVLLSVALIDTERLHWQAMVALILVCLGMVLTARE
ncbi:DMT family transporter [uncultured Desulfosarcina sp.]|uniref:DMT family transporter n=1 Tax=uncultured Desulfosarcina sp. TaxID=218289 RepID=UPI0029C69585|nr:DMT family transporter [uncultured Desulfosarcina sp.]